MCKLDNFNTIILAYESLPFLNSLFHYHLFMKKEWGSYRIMLVQNSCKLKILRWRLHV